MQQGRAEAVHAASPPGGDTCVGRVAELLGAIGACPDDSVFTRVYRDAALAQAVRLDHIPFEQRGPLWGLAVSVKDMFDVAGEVTMAGCARFAGNPPAAQDATVVSRLRQAGAVIIGKTSMPALAYSGLGLNPHFGSPRNALDPARIPGGSSSGAAVAVALGLCDLSIGSDTGGSVRVPAAFNGVVGFKPTQSSIPRDGMAELSPSQDSAGLIAANVAGCARGYAVVAGEPSPGFEPRSPAGLRVAVPAAYLTEDLDPVVARAFERSLGLLRSAGARLARVEFTAGAVIAEILGLGGLVGPEAYKAYRHLLHEPGGLDPFVLGQIRRFAGHPEQDYRKALELRSQAQALYAQTMADFDVLVCPTVPVVAPRFDEIGDSGAALAANRRVLRNTSVFNTLDVPAISLPCQIPAEAAVGLMCAGKHTLDRELLRIAGGIEAVFVNGA